MDPKTMMAGSSARILPVESVRVPAPPAVDEPVASEDLTAALVISSASGSAIPVSNELEPEQVRELLSEHTVELVTAALDGVA
jgi:hypothetical protein